MKGERHIVSQKAQILSIEQMQQDPSGKLQRDFFHPDGLQMHPRKLNMRRSKWQRRA